MRLTRPGARPRQRLTRTGRDRLESTKLRSFVLGARIDDEGAGAQLRPREVLELVASPIRRIELDMEVVVVGAAAGRRLVHRHHVREWLLKQAVVLLEQAFEDSREGSVVVRIEVSQPAAMPDRRDVNLVWPAREGGHKRDPPLIAQDSALA